MTKIFEIRFYREITCFYDQYFFNITKNRFLRGSFFGTLFYAKKANEAKVGLKLAQGLYFQLDDHYFVHLPVPLPWQCSGG